MQTSLLLRDILSTVEIRGFYQAGDEDDVDVVADVADVADVNDVDNDDAEDVDGDGHENPNDDGLAVSSDNNHNRWTSNIIIKNMVKINHNHN